MVYKKGQIIFIPKGSPLYDNICSDCIMKSVNFDKPLKGIVINELEHNNQLFIKVIVLEKEIFYVNVNDVYKWER